MKNQIKNLMTSPLAIARFFALTLALASAAISLPAVSIARSVDHTPVVASIEGKKDGVVAAYLLADGRLQIKQESGAVQTVVLSKTATASLITLAISVADAKLTEQTSAVVCMMMPPESLGELSVSSFNDEERTFTSVRKLVLTNSDCTIAHRVAPTNRKIAENALELRAALTALTLNSLP